MPKGDVFLNNNETVKLLESCHAGIIMATDSIADMLDKITDPKLNHIAASCKNAHEILGAETKEILRKHGLEEKEPSMMAEAMSWLKTNVKIAMDDSDKTVAALLTDGCNMGIKTLRKDLNACKNADESAKSIANRLIELESKFVEDVAFYL